MLYLVLLLIFFLSFYNLNAFWKKFLFSHHGLLFTIFNCWNLFQELWRSYAEVVVPLPHTEERKWEHDFAIHRRSKFYFVQSITIHKWSKNSQTITLVRFMWTKSHKRNIMHIYQYKVILIGQAFRQAASSSQSKYHRHNWTTLSFFF